VSPVGLEHQVPPFLRAHVKGDVAKSGQTHVGLKQTCLQIKQQRQSFPFYV
jgi:hypothetical protein